MILAEKITALRKRNGWSQEELAEQLDISRQSVSKWESAATIPDLDKILKMSNLFGVSTDYLLKDEIEEITAYESDIKDENEIKSISPEEANTFMDLVKNTSVFFAAAASLCIISPVCPIILYALHNNGVISNNMANGIGVSVLLLLVTIAVALFILKGIKLSKYKFLEIENISLQYGVKGIVEKRADEYESTFKISTVIGVALCILGVIPVIALAGVAEMNAVIGASSVGALLVMISAGVNFLVRSAMVNGSFQKLLQTGKFTDENKNFRRKFKHIGGIYWCLAIVIYLTWSLITFNWHTTWIVWPIAGVLFAVVVKISKEIFKSKNN